MGLRLVTAATDGIVSLAEAKAHLRVLHDDEDAEIGAFCDSASEWLSGRNAWLGTSFLPNQWELTAERFPSGRLDIPKPPLKQVDGVFYTPADGGGELEIATFRTIGAGSGDAAYILPAKGADWPATDNEPGSVRILFTSGLATVPTPVKHAALLLVGHWYEHREAVGDAKHEIPMAVDALLAPYRHWAHEK